MIWDCVIVGRGLLGSIVAHFFAKHHPKLQICILDPITAPVKDPRATALAESTVELFKDIGLWEKISPAPIHAIHVGMDLESTPLVFDDTPPVGYNILNTELRTALWDVPGKVFRTNLISIQENAGFSILFCEDGTELHTRLIIGADGRNSKVRQLQTETNKHNYNQTAFTSTIHHEKEHKNKAFEYFIPQGPLAHLPLLDPHKSTFVWSIKNELCPSNEDVAECLKDLLKDRLGKVTIENGEFMTGFPLIGISAAKSFGNRWVLLGDAATTLHPVAGQSLNLGVRDVIRLSETLEDCVGLDHGSYTVLERYDVDRKKDAKSLMAVTLFSASILDQIPFTSTLGLQLLKRLPTTKLFLQKKAQGV